MPNRSPLTDLVQGILHRAGVHLSRYPLRSEFESVLRDFLIGFEVDCVLDVGANVGRYAQALRRIGYRGRVISFEPVPETFRHLEAQAANDPRWEAQRMALGDSEGEVPMRIFPGRTNSTLSEVGDFAREWFPSAFADERVETVPVRRLDALVAAGVVELNGPTLLKVDAEGYDWQVIGGAGELIHDFAGLQMELMVQPLWENTPPFPESVHRLAEMRFDPVSFAVENRTRFSAIVLNGLFRNTRFSPDPDRASLMWNPAAMGLLPQVR